MEKQTFVTFLLGKENFAVNVSKVLEVLERQYITPVPQTPEHILGIINFRGDIMSVVDTRMKFNLPSAGAEDKIYIIVFDISNSTGKFLIAATADAVKDVIEIDDNEIKPVPEMGLHYDISFISGVVRRDDKFILLLNVEKIFALSDSECITTSEIVENN